MNIRLVAVGATLMMLASSSGCSGMRNFLFGRGAACAVGPGVGIAPGLPAMERGCGYEPGCGYELGCGHEPGCGYEPAPRHRPFAGLRGRCGLLHGRTSCAGSPSCNCGAAPGRAFMPGQYDAYSGVVHDPYSHGGGMIGSEVIGDSYGGYPTTIHPGVVYPGGVSVGDNFDVRSDRIIEGPPVPSAQQ